MIPLLDDPRQRPITFSDGDEGSVAALWARLTARRGAEPPPSLQGFLDRAARPDLGLLTDWQYAQAGRALRTLDAGMRDVVGAGAAIVADPARYAEIVAAADRQATMVDNWNARGAALADAYRRRIERIREATGEVLPDPSADFRAQTAAPAEIVDGRFDGERADGQRYHQVPFRELPTRERIRIQGDWFDRRLAELAERHPDRAALFDLSSIPAEARGEAREAERTFDRLREAEGLNTTASLLSQFAGGMVGFARDPIQAVTMLAGGGQARGGEVLQRVASAFWRNALVNAGQTAIAQPDVQRWREEVELRSGVVPALENVGMAALIGGVFGSGVQGVIEVGPILRDAARRVLMGRGTAAEFEEVSRALGLRLDDQEIAAVVRQAAAEAAVDDALARARPPGVPEEAWDDAVTQAVRRAENPLDEGPPDLVALPPPREEARAQVTAPDAEAAPPPQGRAVTVDGRPVTFTAFDAASLGTDAVTFQYKAGGDAQGVIDTLRSVGRWDRTASGKAMIYEFADGRRVVADGHQRLGLAQRLLADGAETRVEIDGFLFRERDGWQPGDVRALAAKKNMQEGSGTALDAARVLRDRPDLMDAALPVTRPMMRQALALARLSDDAFGMVVNGVVEERFGALVGAMVPDATAHAAVLADLARSGIETERAARLFVGEAMEAGVVREYQIDMFGQALVARTLMAERARVLDRALQDLKGEARLFGLLTREADDIAAAGNVLDTTGNASRATVAAQQAELLARLALRSGPVSDLLNVAARTLQDGARPQDAAAAFLASTRSVIERDGLQALIDGPRLGGESRIEPGTPQAVRAAEDAAAALPERPPEPDPNQTSLFDTVPVGERADGTDVRLMRRDDALAAAERKGQDADLIASCRP